MSTPQDTINLTMPEPSIPPLASNRYAACYRAVGSEQTRAAGSEEGTPALSQRAPLHSPSREPPVIMVKE